MRIWTRIRKGWRGGSRESGQSLVETALVFPILISMLVGAADLAQVGYYSIQVENAARAATEYGCQNGFTAQDSTGMQTTATNEAAGISVTATPSSSCICSDGTASTCLNTDCPNSHIEQTLTVSTSATVTPLIHLPLLPSTYTVRGQSIQRVWQ